MARVEQPWVRAVCACYRILLLAYPRAFRHAYGHDMFDLFQTQARSVARHGGRWAKVTFCRDMLSDWSRSVLEEGTTMATRMTLMTGLGAALVLGVLRLSATEVGEPDTSLPAWSRSVDEHTRAQVAGALTVALADADAGVRTAAETALASVSMQAQGPLVVTRRCRGNCLIADSAWTQWRNDTVTSAMQSDDVAGAAELLREGAIFPVTPSGVGALVEALGHRDPGVRQAAAMRLDSVRAPAAVPAWIVALEDANEAVRERAAISLGVIGDPGAIDALTQALVGDAAVAVRWQIVRSLAAIAMGDGALD